MAKKSADRKLFVLDTNVLIHDPSSLFRFEEHDVYVPMVTLEELDHHKKGQTDIARSARQASRYLDQIIGQNLSDLVNGIPLKLKENSHSLGNLFLEGEILEKPKAFSVNAEKPDNQILSTVLALKNKHKDRKVILVSKDINIRIKAHALGIQAEDYHSDKVIEDSDVLYMGHSIAPDNFWEFVTDSWKKDDKVFYRVNGFVSKEWLVGQYLVLPDGGHSKYAVITEMDDEENTILQSITRFDHQKNQVWGIHSRNHQQLFALSALMDPEISFVSLVGQAGSGKTLLALAAGLQQTLEQKIYSEIIFTRVTVPVGDDIGFLPGTEEEKMAPWMGALDDNLEVLHSNGSETTQWGRAATLDLVKSRIKVKSLNFMRGRTFLSKYLIIDEAQNLTPKQMKTLITRAGPGTKVICLGNLAQIDTPYLTEGSSGLTYVVDRFKGNWGMAHVILEKSERSWLADRASQLL